jgi:hypothetical protein
MGPFEFMTLFFSFIYTVSLTHLLFAWTRMVRHRRVLVFSWPHFLWMLVAFASLLANWLALYDFHRYERLSLPTISVGLLFTVIVYLECALVSPDFEDGYSYDMRAFHEQEGATYIGIVLVMAGAALIANILADAALAMQSWGSQNMAVIAMLPPAAIALLVRRPWVQVAMPAIELGIFVGYSIAYYPVLDKALGG